LNTLTIKEQQNILKVLKPPPVKIVLIEVSKMLKEYLGNQTALNQISVNWGSDPFKVLIGTILSHRTKDEMTSKAAEQLFMRFNTPSDLAEANDEEVQSLIRSTGFYRVKARRIKQVSQLLLVKFNGKVPEDMESLLSLPSVGRKTANCVLVYGFKKPAIPVDTHVHRISNRLNLVQTRTPEETEVRLTEIIDKKYWLNLNDIFVRFGKTICKPIGPRCIICNLRIHCAYYILKVKKSQ
jgi:endonuclease-3